jgi:hypothetical protein
MGSCSSVPIFSQDQLWKYLKLRLSSAVSGNVPSTKRLQEKAHVRTLCHTKIDRRDVVWTERNQITTDAPSRMSPRYDRLLSWRKVDICNLLRLSTTFSLSPRGPTHIKSFTASNFFSLQQLQPNWVSAKSEWKIRMSFCSSLPKLSIVHLYAVLSRCPKPKSIGRRHMTFREPKVHERHSLENVWDSNGILLSPFFQFNIVYYELQ